MDFKSYKEESQKHGMGGGFYQLQPGENKVRILTSPEPSLSHFLGQGTKPARCIGQNCPYCAKEIKVSHKIMLYILDRKDGQVKLAEFPWSIFKSLGEMASSSEYGFKDLPPYDVVISKTGEGMETRYTLLAGRNEEPVSQDVLEKLASLKPIVEILRTQIQGGMHDAAKVFVADEPGLPSKPSLDEDVTSDLPF